MKIRNKLDWVLGSCGLQIKERIRKKRMKREDKRKWVLIGLG